MAGKPQFISRNNPTEGFDDVAKGFFDREQARRAAARGEAPPAEEKPASSEEPENELAVQLKNLSEKGEKSEKSDSEAGDEKTDPEDRSGEEISAGSDSQVGGEGLPGDDGDDGDDSKESEPEIIEIPLEAKLTLPDGTETTYRDLQEGYQRQQDYTRKTMELAEQRRLFEEKVNEAYQAFDQQVRENSEIAQQLHAHLGMIAPNPKELERLRQVDPGEYAARVEDMRMKQAVIERARKAQKIAEEEAARRLEMQRQARIPLERKALAESIPAFKKNFDAEYAMLGRYAVASDGGRLRPEEWDLVDDHRYVTLVWKAREYDRATRSTAPVVRAKMGKQPKRVRPGSPREAGETRANEVNAAMANLKANPGSTDALAAAFLARERAKRAKGQEMRRRV